MHILLNEMKELAAQKKVPHRDFYNIRKVRSTKTVLAQRKAWWFVVIDQICHLKTVIMTCVCQCRWTRTSTRHPAWTRSTCCASSRGPWKNTLGRLFTLSVAEVKPSRRFLRPWTWQPSTWASTHLTCMRWAIAARRTGYQPLWGYPGHNKFGPANLFLFVYRTATRSIALTNSMPNTTPLENRSSERSSSRLTIMLRGNTLHT